ncbi:hypothetical protein [Streptomyces blattellae]|uniref:hypothetical protein n=1 Tax=Streptomyces blattellae TaxID=2569855 RepID=UPI0012B9617E|nr:hypothetical protein [Streptomyces blattellae]
MHTSPARSSWRPSAILLVISGVVTFLLSAIRDALALRAQRRRVPRQVPAIPTTDVIETYPRPDRTLVRHRAL